MFFYNCRILTNEYIVFNYASVIEIQYGIVVFNKELSFKYVSTQKELLRILQKIKMWNYFVRYKH
uniref:Uncharacterized protein n=1 Tax=Lepeophtheirus salmonis TaxID=72036 RepID=A0A0K2TXP9_LEPSM